MDWVMAALDRLNRQVTGEGNDSQVVLELDGSLDTDRFTREMAAFLRQCPILGGRPARDWTLAPYWRLRPSPDGVAPAVAVRESDPGAVHAALEDCINRRSAQPGPGVEFSVVGDGAWRTCVAMRFNHLLLDAAGAELFLESFQRWRAGEDLGTSWAAIPSTPPSLFAWRRAWAGWRRMAPALRRLSDASLVTLPLPSALRGRPTRFRVLEFGPDAAAAIAERADREAGYLLFTPYLVAVTAQALARVIRERGLAGRDLIVPVSVDQRAAGPAGRALFFNHHSFVFFRIPLAALDDRRAVLERIRRQFYEQVREGFAQALVDACGPLRWLPLPWAAHVLRRPMKGQFATFGLAAVGQGGDTLPPFMGAEVRNLYHMPLASVPPGLGFAVNRYAGRLNVVLCYRDGVLTDGEADRVEADLRHRL